MPENAAAVLDREFLDLRARILELCASLDRIDRASGRAQGDKAADPRLDLLRRGIAELASAKPGRAERFQLIASLPYDPDWRRKLEVPAPRSQR